MLLHFSFSNFRSFREKATISMKATSQTTLNDVLIRNGGRRILPAAILYGANASGKSNTILAMMVFCDIVRRGSIARSINAPEAPLELFPFLHDNNADPISFEIEFVEGGSQFLYKLAFSIEPLKQNGKRCVTEETLEQVVKKGRRLLFHRSKDSIKIGDDKDALKLMGHDKGDLIKEFEKTIIKNMDETTLFLSGGFKSTICKPVADKVIGYMTENIMPTLDLSNSIQDIVAFDSTDGTMEDDDWMISDERTTAVIREANLGPQKIGWKMKDGSGQDGNRFEMFSVYNGLAIPSEIMESVGSIRLIQFIGHLEHVFSSGGLTMIDEMDNALHPEIIKGVLAAFGNPEINRGGAQLVFTSHNPIYMDHDLLRRDQILFVEKDTDTFESRVYSLGDFGSVSVRNDQSFIKNYFKGRYGSLPYVDLETIFAHSKDDAS